MDYDICRSTTCDVNHGMDDIQRGPNKWPCPTKILVGVGMALEWATEKLDRKFLAAMERCVKEDTDRRK